MSVNSSVVVKTLPERLSRPERAKFRQEMQRILVTDQPRVVLDFESVTQLDSAGIEVLLNCLADVTQRDGELKLADLSPQAAVILNISRVGRFFEIFPTVADAVESFNVSPADAGDFSEPWNSLFTVAESLERIEGPELGAQQSWTKASREAL
jgi:anti-anti-sigma factor